MTSSEKSISRRSFLGLTGAAATITAGAGLYGCAQPASSSGGSLASTKGSAAGPIEAVFAPASWDEEADVVVVGTGGGLVAAAYAAQAGKKVVVLEKASTWGGSSKETDNFSVMGTKTQQAIYQGLAAQMKAAGQDEAAAQFEQMGALDPMVMRAQWKEKFYVKPNGGDVGELPNGEEGPRACAPIQPMFETLTACIPDAIDYMGAVGVSWGPVTEFGSAGFVSGVCPEGSEQGSLIARANYTVFEILYNFCLDQGAVFHFLTPATALVVEDGRVVGVQATGDVSFVKANDGVVLATGGMTFNMDMLEEYVPHVARRCLNSTAASTDEGDGIRMGAWVGGAIDEAPHCPMYFDEGVEGLEHMPSIPLTRQPWLYLNDLGERFCNEDMPYAFVCRAHNAQPRHMKWVFWDSKWEIDGPAMGMVVCKDFRSPLHNPEEIQQFIEEGTILSADTIDGLLAKMEGIDAETAKASIERYNELCAAGVDEDFGKRRQCLSSLTEPPFYGVHAGTTLLVTMGGLKINENQQVIDADAHPIEGLWAAGNCSGSFFFGDYPITISGASHGRACTGGRRAGQFAADRALGA